MYRNKMNHKNSTETGKGKIEVYSYIKHKDFNAHVKQINII
jgi:hypothetical protein